MVTDGIRLGQTRTRQAHQHPYPFSALTLTLPTSHPQGSVEERHFGVRCSRQPSQPSAVSRVSCQPSAVSRQPSAVSRQPSPPSAVSRLNRQLSAVSCQPSAVSRVSRLTLPESHPRPQMFLHRPLHPKRCHFQIRHPRRFLRPYLLLLHRNPLHRRLPLALP